MDNPNDNTTQDLLSNRIDKLQSDLDDINERRSFLLLEIAKTEKALSVIIPKRQGSYGRDWSIREKIIFSLNLRKKVLSVSEIVDILQPLDEELRNDNLNAVRIVRVQVGKMLNEKILVQYKTDKMRYILYALKNWTDDIGEIKEKYL